MSNDDSERERGRKRETSRQVRGIPVMLKKNCKVFLSSKSKRSVSALFSLFPLVSNPVSRSLLGRPRRHRLDGRLQFSPPLRNLRDPRPVENAKHSAVLGVFKVVQEFGGEQKRLRR